MFQTRNTARAECVFTTQELQRLMTYRNAVKAGFYNEGFQNKRPSARAAGLDYVGLQDGLVGNTRATHG